MDGTQTKVLVIVKQQFKPLCPKQITLNQSALWKLQNDHR